MGGNGAIVCALRNPELFQTISVLAPSCNPTSWGDKIIYIPYLGEENKELWKIYDAYDVAKAYQGPLRNILVDCVSGNLKKNSSLKEMVGYLHVNLKHLKM